MIPTVLPAALRLAIKVILWGASFNHSFTICPMESNPVLTVIGNNRLVERKTELLLQIDEQVCGLQHNEPVQLQLELQLLSYFQQKLLLELLVVVSIDRYHNLVQNSKPKTKQQTSNSN